MAAAYRLPDDPTPATVDPAEAAASAPAADADWALPRGEVDDRPGEPRVGLASRAVWSAVPGDINALRRSAPTAALAWAEGSRAAALDLIARGYQVDAFANGAYRWRPRAKGAE